MYSSIYTDWQWPSKRTLMLLPLNLLESAVIQWSVCLNSLWLYCSPFFNLSLSFLSIFPSSLLFSSPHPSQLLNLILQTPWKQPLEEDVVWRLALLVSWWKSICTGILLEQRPSPILSAECPPPWDHMRPLPKTQKWADHWYQHIQLYVITSNNMATWIQHRTVPDNKRCTINHQAILLFCPTYSSFSLISNMLFILISFFSFSFLHPLSSPLALFSCSWNLPFSPLAKHTLNINVKK